MVCPLILSSSPRPLPRVQLVCKLAHCDYEAVHKFRWDLAMAWMLD